jgi:hypothetical protein
LDNFNFLLEMKLVCLILLLSFVALNMAGDARGSVGSMGLDPSLRVPPLHGSMGSRAPTPQPPPPPESFRRPATGSGSPRIKSHGSDKVITEEGLRPDGKPDYRIRRPDGTPISASESLGKIGKHVAEDLKNDVLATAGLGPKSVPIMPTPVMPIPPSRHLPIIGKDISSARDVKDTTFTEPQTGLTFGTSYDSCGLVEAGVIRVSTWLGWWKLAAMAIYKCSPSVLAEEIVEITIYTNLITNAQFKSSMDELLDTKDSAGNFFIDREQKTKLKTLVLNFDSKPNNGDDLKLISKNGGFEVNYGGRSLGSDSTITMATLDGLISIFKQHYLKTK